MVLKVQGCILTTDKLDCQTKHILILIKSHALIIMDYLTSTQQIIILEKMVIGTE